MLSSSSSSASLLLAGTVILAVLGPSAAAPAPVALPHPPQFQRYGTTLETRQVSNATSSAQQRNDATGFKGAAASEVAECSQIAVDILKQGGNAADGVIAAALCVGTIAAYHSGIGGGGFLIVRFQDDKEKDGHGYSTIDFRETAPAASNETMYSALGSDQTASTIGGLAVGVPGELRAWEKLHSEYGSLPWFDLFQPAINLARNGFTVNPDLAAAISGYNVTQLDPLFAESYAPNGTILVEGDTAYRLRFADTLEKIANSSANTFYSGEIAQGIVDTVQANGGIMTLDDLAGYKAVERVPLNITFRDQRIFSTVAPSSGAVVLSALKIFEGFNSSYGVQEGDPAINVTTQRLIESTRFAYGQRTDYGDPAFTANVSRLEREYITYPVAETVRDRIVDGKSYALAYYEPEEYFATREGGTSHLAVVDGQGNAVSLTTTVNLYWGAQIMTEQGIVLNNEMDDFSSPGQTNSFGFAASPINYIASGKRPQSSIASSIAENLETGKLTIATGSAGGSRIITATLQELYHHINQGKNASECVHSPRWHDQLSGPTYLELPAPALGLAGFNNATAAYLNQTVGYDIVYQGVSGSTSHIIVRGADGLLEAASDPRKPAGAGAAF